MFNLNQNYMRKIFLLFFALFYLSLNARICTETCYGHEGTNSMQFTVIAWSQESDGDCVRPGIDGQVYAISKTGFRNPRTGSYTFHTNYRGWYPSGASGC